MGGDVGGDISSACDTNDVERVGWASDVREADEDDREVTDGDEKDCATAGRTVFAQKSG